MSVAIKASGKATVRLAKLFACSSSQAPVHFALCPQVGCATALAIALALGASGISRLLDR